MMLHRKTLQNINHDDSSSRSLGFIVFFVMDTDNRRELGHGRLDLFAYLVGNIGHHVTTSDLYETSLS